jgi:copper chaperone
MKTEKILIANMKCSGCVNTVEQKIAELSGVHKVEVDLKNDSVTVDFDETISHEEIAKILQTIGYPEATEENGLLFKLKSHVTNLTEK